MAKTDNEQKNDKTEARLTALEKKVAGHGGTLSKVLSFLEKFTKKDLNMDGKIGLFLLALLSASAVFAAENQVIRWIAQEGNDAVLTLEADQGDDAADELQVIMKAAGNASVEIGGSEVLAISSAGVLSGFSSISQADTSLTTSNLTAQGTITLLNGETVDNATDGDVVFTYDDDSARLADFIIKSVVPGDGVANNNTLQLSMVANDDLTNATEYLAIGATLLDVTHPQEDSTAYVNYLVAGASKTVFLAGSEAGSPGLMPNTDNEYDIGRSSVELKDGYFDGTVRTDKLDVDETVVLNYVNKTGNYTNTTTDCVVSFNTSAVTTNTLPEASTVLGQMQWVALQDDDGDLVVVTDGTDTFDGTNTAITFADAGDSLCVMATAANVYTILVNVGGTLSAP